MFTSKGKTDLTDSIYRQGVGVSDFATFDRKGDPTPSTRAHAEGLAKAIKTSTHTSRNSKKVLADRFHLLLQVVHPTEVTSELQLEEGGCLKDNEAGRQKMADFVVRCFYLDTRRLHGQDQGAQAADFSLDVNRPATSVGSPRLSQETIPPPATVSTRRGLPSGSIVTSAGTPHQATPYNPHASNNSHPLLASGDRIVDIPRISTHENWSGTTLGNEE